MARVTLLVTILAALYYTSQSIPLQVENVEDAQTELPKINHKDGLEEGTSYDTIDETTNNIIDTDKHLKVKTDIFAGKLIDGIKQSGEIFENAERKIMGGEYYRSGLVSDVFDNILDLTGNALKTGDSILGRVTEETRNVLNIPKDALQNTRNLMQMWFERGNKTESIKQTDKIKQQTEGTKNEGDGEEDKTQQSKI